MKQTIILAIALLLCVRLLSQGQDRAIRDTGGGAATEHDTSATFHVRLTFGDEYSLSLATLDTADIISIYGGSQTGNISTITLPELGTTGKYDGKWIHIRGQAAGESGASPFIITHETTASDILVLHQQTGAKTGNDTIYSTYGDNYRYYISDGRYFRYAQAPVVWQMTNVTNLTKADGQAGDIAINAARDSLALFSAYWPYVIHVKLGSSAPTASNAVLRTGVIGTQATNTTYVQLTGSNFSGTQLNGGWTASNSTDDLTYSGTTAKFLATFDCTGDGPEVTEFTIAILENGSETDAWSTDQGEVNTDYVFNWHGSTIVTANNGDVVDSCVLDRIKPQ